MLSTISIENQTYIVMGYPMTETFAIAGYCRISVDDELDRDRSGYTFEQREG